MTGQFIWIDWLILLIPAVAVIWIGYQTQKHMHGVSDFLAGGRCAGRYLISVASAEAGFGLISVVALFEQWYKGGFAIGFWGAISTPVGLILGLTGFAIYRYRQTRAMTIGQFYQMRYSQGVRQMAGVVAWLSGVINYAVFPAVGGRFLVHYCQLPLTVNLIGFEMSTYGLVMAIFLGVALTVALLGGQVTIMVTDCVQGLFSYTGYAIVLVSIFCLFNFDQFREAMLARPPGESFVNPFDTSKLSSFNVLFVFIGIFASIYNRISWQGAAGYNCAAASPHEQKMGNLLGTWRAGFSMMMLMLLLVGAYTLMNHPDFADKAQAVHAELVARINADNPGTTETLRNQMLVPVAVRSYLPVGVTGLFCALMMMLMVSTDTTYLHSWGTMFIQDVVLPFRRNPFKPTQQILFIRLSIAAVAVFAWFFSFFYSQTTYLMMFMMLTGALYLGFAGALILGGLYWKRGTTAGAYTAIAVGVFAAILSFVCTQFWGSHIFPWLSVNAPSLLGNFKLTLQKIGETVPIVNWEWSETRFPITGVELGFLNILFCVGSYALVSVATCRTPFNLDRMLHRGAYAHEDTADSVTGQEIKRTPLWRKLTGITHEYSRGDRLLAWSVIIWTMSHFAMFLSVVFLNTLVGRWSDDAFFRYWKYWQVGLTILVGCVTTVWFTWGGTRDLIRFFRALKSERVDDLDDGRVIGHVNADDVALVEQVEQHEIPEPNQDEDANRGSME